MTPDGHSDEVTARGLFLAASRRGQFVLAGRWSNYTIGPTRLGAGSGSAYEIRTVGNGPRAVPPDDHRSQTEGPATKLPRHCEEGKARRTPGWPLLPLRGNSPSGNPLDFPDTNLVLPSIHGIATALRASQ